VDQPRSRRTHRHSDLRGGPNRRRTRGGNRGSVDLRCAPGERGVLAPRRRRLTRRGSPPRHPLPGLDHGAGPPELSAPAIPIRMRSARPGAGGDDALVERQPALPGAGRGDDPAGGLARRARRCLQVPGLGRPGRGPSHRSLGSSRTGADRRPLLHDHALVVSRRIPPLCRDRRRRPGPVAGPPCFREPPGESSGRRGHRRLECRLPAPAGARSAPVARSRCLVLLEGG
jgi:hypothetical protein